MTTDTAISDADLAVAWCLAARAMAAAGARDARAGEAAAGLYAQAILGLSEQACLDAKGAEGVRARSLVDCLGIVGRLPRPVAEKVVTGVMMLALRDARMRALEVRWASMLASAAKLSPDGFQECCASARVIASMLRPPDDSDGPDASTGPGDDAT